MGDDIDGGAVGTGPRPAGRLAGKVAMVTGAARGAGRGIAVGLAAQGADVVVTDVCGRIGTVPYGLAGSADLDETARLVDEAGGGALARAADVRDVAALAAAADAAVERFGHLDTVVANAGILSLGSATELSEQAWTDVLDVDLTGVWHTAKATIPRLTDHGGGTITVINSDAGLTTPPGAPHYVAAKWGAVGLARALAVELAPQRIRVNSVHPFTINTEMLHQGEDAEVEPGAGSPLGVPWIEVEDLAHAVVFLASDEARYVTGVSLPVDAGATLT